MSQGALSTKGLENKEQELCKICLLNFSDKDSLTCHMRQVHFGIRQYRCGVCSQSFEKQSLVLQHYKVCTGSKSSPQIDSDKQVQEVVKKTFTNKYNMIKSRLRPTMERFKCVECGIKLSTAKSLQDHKSVHDIKKPLKRNNSISVKPQKIQDILKGDKNLVKQVTTKLVKSKLQTSCIFCKHKCPKSSIFKHLDECHSHDPDPSQYSTLSLHSARFYYKCLRCGMVSDCLSRIQGHLLFFNCPFFCLDNSELTNEQPKYSQQCSVCYLNFRDTASHNVHMATVHYPFIYMRDEIDPSVLMSNIMCYFVTNNACKFCASQNCHMNDNPKAKSQYCASCVYKCPFNRCIQSYKESPPRSPMFQPCKKTYHDYKSLKCHVRKMMASAGTELAYRCNNCSKLIVLDIPSVADTFVYFPKCCNNFKCYCCGNTFLSLYKLINHLLDICSKDRNLYEINSINEINSLALSFKSYKEDVAIDQENIMCTNQKAHFESLSNNINGNPNNKTLSKTSDLESKIPGSIAPNSADRYLICPLCNSSYKDKAQYIDHDCIKKCLISSTDPQFHLQEKNTAQPQSHKNMATNNKKNNFICPKCFASFEHNHLLCTHKCSSTKYSSSSQAQVTAFPRIAHEAQQSLKVIKKLLSNPVVENSVQSNSPVFKTNNESVQIKSDVICSKCNVTYKKTSHSEHICGFVCHHCNIIYKTHVKFLSHRCVVRGIVPKHMFTTTIYKCYHCGGTFSSLEYLKHHQCSVLAKRTCLHCKLCFPTVEELEKHVRREICKTKICRYCDESVKGGDIEMKMHMKQKHLFPCKKCYFVLHSKSTFIQHMMQHDGKEYVCPICSEIFPSNFKLNEHVDIVHGKSALKVILTQENYLSCSYCTERFLKPQTLQDHIQFCHMDIFKCVVCGKRFKSEDELATHRFSHKVKHNNQF